MAQREYLGFMQFPPPIIIRAFKPPTLHKMPDRPVWAVRLHRIAGRHQTKSSKINLQVMIFVTIPRSSPFPCAPLAVDKSKALQRPVHALLIRSDHYQTSLMGILTALTPEMCENSVKRPNTI
jgi:hypothetical protein